MSVKYINNGRKANTGNATRRPMPRVTVAIPEAKQAIPKKEVTQVNKSSNKKTIIREEEELKTLKETIQDESLPNIGTVVIPEVEEDPEEEMEETVEETEEEKEETKTHTLEDLGIYSRKVKKAFRSMGIVTAEDLAHCDPVETFNKLPEGYLKEETFTEYYENAINLL